MVLLAQLHEEMVIGGSPDLMLVNYGLERFDHDTISFFCCLGALPILRCPLL